MQTRSRTKARESPEPAAASSTENRRENSPNSSASSPMLGATPPRTLSSDPVSPITSPDQIPEEYNEPNEYYYGGRVIRPELERMAGRMDFPPGIPLSNPTLKPSSKSSPESPKKLSQKPSQESSQKPSQNSYASKYKEYQEKEIRYRVDNDFFKTVLREETSKNGENAKEAAARKSDVDWDKLLELPRSTPEQEPPTEYSRGQDISPGQYLFSGIPLPDFTDSEEDPSTGDIREDSTTPEQDPYIERTQEKSTPNQK
ncbi:uncharacterized protein K452DRAFT_296474 [Aplosporella prunicola CBS 121167]|uniref:Uncharacterized protein n=1 Tax=Aplosporella prunicola CBS 121167 TaxID=1176127 RepID=A0A6A6BKR8_9PEZI|nr:uncharacterized protein K452DRAFT_296474 [Aplosporella prunicola CBS 121167]KAF2144268.1 hypothetical protein K452DRAFT_296474 [Aplosporella prunicola CBS 121167]